MTKALIITAVFLAGLSVFTTPATAMDRELSTEILALHWHPSTAEDARRRTLALATVEHIEANFLQWRQQLDSRVLTLERLADRVSPRWAPTMDGGFGWLIHAQVQPASARLTGFSPSLQYASDLLLNEDAAGRLARLYQVTAMEAPTLWLDLAERLSDQGVEQVSDDIRDYWQPLLNTLTETTHPPWAAHATAQAERVLTLAGTAEPDAREKLIAGLLLEEARLDWSLNRRLAAVWGLLDGLVRLTTIEQPAGPAAAFQDQLVRFADTAPRQLRQLDSDLPVVLALMQDAAGYLAAEEPSVRLAISELADAYARLALFVPDASFYLDQPVRDHIRQGISQCNADPLMVGPVPREIFEACLARVLKLLSGALESEELTGGSGPFAAQFLRREMGLVSWQRASYLDGHLNWRLQTTCEPTRWINVLEWSLLMQYLRQWILQRPVFFGSPHWQDAIEDIAGTATGLEQGRTSWIDCITGMGSERRDPILRLLARHERSHAALARALAEANEQFYSVVTRLGADINLDGGADQGTSYRPETLMVTACPESNTCGARIELPVSRALLGLFPNAYLLADQLRMGELKLCYSNVGWVEREARPARLGDDRVANYHGRLSFELVGAFVEGEQMNTVFRQRLTAGESSHYLFASSDPEMLELECTHNLAGEPIASRLPEGRPGLVPNRLTYFTSTPTTPEAELAANWDRGEEWRDWFVTGDRVELLDQEDGQILELAVQAHLGTLISRRERQLSGRLLSTLASAQSDALTAAMADIVEHSALLRRILEIHYPRILRHEDGLRALLVGDSGLLTRDRVRQLRDAGVPMAQVPTLGQERLTRLRTLWLSQPLLMRESGQSAPELDYGLEQLETLVRVTRFRPASVEPSAGQQSTE